VDAGALVKAFQAISRETAGERLPERVLGAAIELAGARRGVFLRELPDGLAVAARIGVAADGSELDAPPELLEDARRSRKPVVRGSACCVPLAGRNGLLGLLVLDRPDEVAGESTDFLGALAEVAAMALENTELRHREDSLRRSEELHRRAISQAGAVPYVLDYASNTYTFMGEGIEELTGYTPAELDHELFGSLVLATYLQGDQAGLDPYEASLRTRGGEFGRWRADLRLRRRDGELRWLSDASVEVLGEDGRSVGSIGMLQDITDRMRTDEERVRLAAIVESTTDVVAQTDPKGRILYLNRAGRRLLGLDEHRDLEGLSLQDFHPAWARARVAFDGIPTASRDGVWTAESALVSGGGREIPVSEVLLAHRDPDGNAIYLSMIARDTSERRELEARLRQAQKMEAVGRLAGGIAHDFNNLLTAIGGYSMIVLDRLAADDELRADVEEIVKAGDLAAGLTRQLLVFSRQQVLEPQVLDLNHVVRDLESLLRRLIREDIELVTRLATQPVLVRADPAQLSQVIVNLAVNAEDAMPDGGCLTIETGALDFDEHAPAGPGEGRMGPHALLAVSDTGAGMDDDTRTQIFEPFFTTKQRGKGTGLGLSTVYGIVEQSGGDISVDSELGRGTTMKVYLPRVDEVEAPGPAPKGAVQELSGQERVLLVEDDAAVRKFARDVLRMRGYTVVDAADGEEALRLADTATGAFDVLITDLVMPGLSGRELAARLLERSPELRTVFISGYTDDAIFRFGALAAGQAFLQKPFTPERLARTVRELLDVRTLQST